MGNIDEKRLSALLERIGKIKVELEALENEVRGLGEVAEVTEPTHSVAEPVEVTEPTIEAIEVSSTPIDDAPIEIDIQDIDIPPIVEDPAPEYTVASVASASSATENIPAAETIAPVAEATPSVTEPVEVTLPTEAPASEPAEATTGIETPVAEPVVRQDSPTFEATVPSESQPIDDLPFGDDLPIETEEEPLFKADEPEPPQKPRKAIVDSTKAETAVMDVMADNQAWRTDRPGLQVKNVISAISLNDRVLLINVLFKEDPLLFQSTISAFNAMTTLDEAVSYIQTNFPEWDLNSEPVYRLMMAVRRKLR